MDEGGTDLVQVAEMHDPNTGTAQVCAGGVSHWPLPSWRREVVSNTPPEEKKHEAPQGWERRRDPSRSLSPSLFMFAIRRSRESV